MPNPVTILHLSDFHFQARRTYEIDIVIKALIADLTDLRDSHGLEPDFVIFSGDLVFAGDVIEDFTAAVDRLSDILSCLDLSYDHLFLCPGNHDVQRSVVDNNMVVEIGLRGLLESRQTVNDFIGKNIVRPQQRDCFDRLENVGAFWKSYGSKFLVLESPFFTCYSIPWGNASVGLACLNSAWRSYGGDDADYGNLIIGERAVDTAARAIADCDLRIGVVHHPLEYCQWFERTHVKRSIMRNFHLWLRGHTHESEMEVVRSLDQNSTVLIVGGALFQDREYFNGYSIIQYDLTNQKGNVTIREYRDRGSKFVPASFVNGEGNVPLDLITTKLLEPVSYGIVDLSAPDNIPHLASLYNDGSVESPRPNLTDIFVVPPLAKQSERATKAVSSAGKGIEFLNLDQLLQNNKNLLFLGQKETGKTTLLNYIRKISPEVERFDKPRFPVYLNFSEIPKGRNSVLRMLRDTVDEYVANLNFNLEDQLASGDVLLLIDDVDIKQRREFAALQTFVSEHQDCRFILTSREEIGDSLLISSDIDLSIEYEEVYIHTFGHGEIVQYFEKWSKFVGLSWDIDYVTQRVFLSLLESRMPLTPLNVTLLAMILTEQRDFIPVNQASLIQKILEVFLEKLNPVQEPLGIDYRIREDFLSSMAYWMSTCGNSRPTTVEFFREASDYFVSIGISLDISELIDFLLIKGILLKIDQKIGFRFSCFEEFFRAKFALEPENKDFYDWLLEEDNYLDFSSEIGYITGLFRKNQDILNRLESYALSSFELVEEELSEDVTFEGFDHFQPSPFNISDLSDVCENERDHEQSTESPDIADNNSENNRVTLTAELDLRDEESVRSTHFRTLELYAKVIKYCELIRDVSVKKQHLGTLMELYLKNVLVSLQESIRYLKDDDFRRENPSIIEGIEKFPIDFSVLYFLTMGSVMGAWLGTPKLEDLLAEEVIDESNHISIRIVFFFMLMEMRKGDYLKHLNRLFREVMNHNFFREVLETKSVGFYLNRALTRIEEQEIENILADYCVAKNEEHPSNKSRHIADLRKQKLLSNQ